MFARLCRGVIAPARLAVIVAVVTACWVASEQAKAESPAAFARADTVWADPFLAD